MRPLDTPGAGADRPDGGVEGRLASMLRATGRYEPDACDLMARWAGSFYETMASRSGVSAEDLYARFPLRVGTGNAEASRPDSRSAFEKWFGSSKVVDSDGRPLVVYHGGQRLTAWNRKGDGRQIYGGHAQAVKDAYGSVLSPLERQALDKPVHFFTDDLSVAEGYADQGEHYEVRSEFLRMERPLDLRADVVGDEVVEQHLRRILGPDFEMPSPGYGQEREISQALRWNWSRVREAVEQMGYDGIILYDTDVRDRGLHTSYAVFEPAQIKSADANDGSFDLDDPDRLSQHASARQPRGTFDPRTLEIALGPKADASTWIHETGHFFLEAMTALASAPDAPKDIVEDMNRVLEWFGIESDPALPRRRTALETWLAMSTDERRPHHERWARAVEQYVMEGRAPNEDLEPLFKTFARWLCSLYTSVKEFLAMRTESTATPSGATASAPLPERPVLADGPAFLAWFGDSKVVDGEGRPLVVYHGTAQDFGAAAAFRASERGTFGAGIYFASPPEMASEWAIGHDGGRIMPVHLSITGPFHTRADYAVGEDCDVDSPAVPLIEAVFGHDSAAVIETLRNTEDGHLGESVRQRLMELGYDGIVATYSDGSREYIAFRPEQIKSALGNDGSFDRDDPSILSQGARASCHPELTDEIRRVMDRMLSIQHGRHAHEAEEAEREEGFPVEAMRMRA